jgi:hypothetical protein
VEGVRILKKPIKASSHYKKSGIDKELEIGMLTPAEEQDDSVPSEG